MSPQTRSPLALLFPHRTAERVMDDLIDAKRDGAELDAADAAWLNRHLDGCSKCKAAFEHRERAIRLAAAWSVPELSAGFAGRVRAAAVASVAEGETKTAGGGAPLGWLLGAATVAGLGLMLSQGVSTLTGPGTEVAIGGTGHLAEAAPHFVVRARGLGPVETRSRAVGVVSSHRGSTEVDSTHVRAVIPRSELVALMAELERWGGVEVELEREPDTDDVVLHFQLD